jgi:ornithine cyclodeaminase
MRMLNAEETQRALPYAALCESIAAVLETYRQGRIVAPERLVTTIGSEGRLLLMPAADDRLTITKLVTVHPGNRDRGLPTVQGAVIVIRTADGHRLGMVDGATVTARRTAALSALAARCLAREPQGPMLVVGAGVQAEAHLEAFMEVLGTKTAFIASRTHRHAVQLAERAQAKGLEAQAIDDPHSAQQRVSLIVTATDSPRPVLAETVRPETFIAAVGAFSPEMAEIPERLVRRALLFTDTLEGARVEAGDYLQAGVDWAKVTPLAMALREPPPAVGPVIFKSVGHAMFDLAAARLIF